MPEIKKSYIPNRLKNAAEEGYVAGAEDIIDDALGRSQDDINNDIYATGEGILDRLDQLTEQVRFDGQWQATSGASDIVGGSGKIATAGSVRGAIDVKTGYFSCGTAAGTTKKEVSAAGYVLSGGGAIKIYMENANTANNATLDIKNGNTSTGEKALYYNGERASADNSWGAEEVISVYYDASGSGAYYATNAQGGGKAEKIKYDDTDSGLVSENVQDALDNIGECLQNCIHSSDATEPQTETISNSDLVNKNASWSQNSDGRLILTSNALIDVSKALSVTLSVASNVSSDANITQYTLPMYNKNKEYLSGLDLGWKSISSVRSIDIDLTSPTYSQVAYVGIYLGADSASTRIEASSIDDSKISYSIFLPAFYATRAVDEGMLDEVVENLQDFESSITGNRVTPFSLVGNNKTAVQRYFKLTAGHKYKLTTDMTSADYSNSSITNKVNVYSLAYTSNGSSTNVFITQKDMTTPQPEYTFTAVEADSYCVTIRANSGTTINLSMIEYIEASLVDETPVSESSNMVSSGGLFDILKYCHHTRGAGEETETVVISSGDLANTDQAGHTVTKRIAMKANALIPVDSVSRVVLSVDYDAISDPNIDRFLIPFYDKDKVYQNSLDQGWTMFDGADKTIDVDLTGPQFESVAYVGIYFGSDDEIISPSSIDTSYISYTLYLSSSYWSEAASVEMVNYRSMATYYGQKIVLEHNYDYEVYFNMPSASQNRQGAATYGNYLFQCFNTNAYVQVWDLSNKSLTQTIDLTSDANNHAAGASFGAFYDITDPFPLLYIAAFNSNYIYVYRITGTIGSLTMSLIQTITIDSSLMYLPNMVIDRENMKMILYGYNINSYSQAANNYLKFAVLDVPPTDSDLTITQSELDRQFTIPYRFACQDAVAYYGKMLMFWGYAGNVQGSGFIQVDYANGLLISDADTNVMLDNTDEVQGVGIWNGGIITTSHLGSVRLLEF